MHAPRRLAFPDARGDNPPAMTALVEFGVFQFDPRTGELRRQGRRVALAPQPAALLAALLARPGELIPREELRAALWPDGAVVEYEAGIAAALRQVRAALGDDSRSPRFVQTVHRRGYRFLAPVSKANADPSPAGAEVLPGEAPGVAQGRQSRDGAVAPSVRAGRGRPIAAVAFALAAVVAAAVAFVPRRTRGEASRIAILPVRHADSEPELADPADFAGESFATALARAGRGRVEVVSRLATMGFPKDWRPWDMRRLPADYVVDASLRRAGERVRLHAKLARIEDLRILWIRDIEIPRASLAAELDRVVGPVAASMLSEIDHPESMRGAPRRDTPAYDKWLSARLCLREGDPARAVARLKESADLDSSRAGPHAALAQALLVGVRMGVFAPKAAMGEAASAVKRALALDPESPATQAALGGLLWVRRHPGHGEAQLRRALRADPGDALARMWLAAALAAGGDRAEGECEASEALARDPAWVYLLKEAQFQGLTDIPS